MRFSNAGSIQGGGTRSKSPHLDDMPRASPDESMEGVDQHQQQRKKTFHQSLLVEYAAMRRREPFTVQRPPVVEEAETGGRKVGGRKKDVASKTKRPGQIRREEEAKNDMRRKNRFRPGTVAIREIKKY